MANKLGWFRMQKRDLRKKHHLSYGYDPPPLQLSSSDVESRQLGREEAAVRGCGLSLRGLMALGTLSNSSADRCNTWIWWGCRIGFITWFTVNESIS